MSQPPGSKSFKDLGQNAKEEASNVAKELKDAISGANDQTSELGNDLSAVDSLKADLVRCNSLGDWLWDSLDVWALDSLPWNRDLSRASARLFLRVLSCLARRACCPMQAHRSPLFTSLVKPA